MKQTLSREEARAITERSNIPRLRKYGSLLEDAILLLEVAKAITGRGKRPSWKKQEFSLREANAITRRRKSLA
jgi:hypothetical protein